MGLAFTYLMTYGGSVIALFRPWHGLLIYICFSRVKPEALWHWSVPIGNYSRIIAVSAILGWVFSGCGIWRLGKASAVYFCLSGYWILSLVWLGFAPDQELAYAYFDTNTKIFVPALMGITMINDVKALRELAWVIFLTEAYLCYEANLSYFGGINILGTGRFVGVDNNSNAIMINTCIGLGFFLAMGDPSWIRKIVAFSGLLFMIHAVLFSSSRGGMLGLIVMGAVAFLLTPKQPKHYLAFAIMVAIGVRLAGPQVVERFKTAFAEGEERDASAASRVKLWGWCWESMQESPLGLGPNMFPDYAYRRGYVRKMEAHSLWMQTGAELGFPGLGCLAGFYVICMGRLFVLMRKKPFPYDPWLKDAAMMVFASLTGFMVSASFVTIEGMETPYYVCMMGAGVLKLTSQPQSALLPAFQTGFREHPSHALAPA